MRAFFFAVASLVAALASFTSYAQSAAPEGIQNPSRSGCPAEFSEREPHPGPLRGDLWHPRFLS